MTLLFALLYAALVGVGIIIVLMIYACQLLQRGARALETMAEAIDAPIDPWRGQCDPINGGAET